MQAKVRPQAKDRLSLVLVLFLLFPCFEPAYFEDQLPMVDTVFLAWRLLSMTVAFVIAVRSYGISSLLVSVLCFQGYLTANTMIHDGPLMVMGFTFLKVLSVCIILEMLLRRQPMTVVNTLIAIFTVYIVISVVTTYQNPDGLYVASEGVYAANQTNSNAIRYFLGHKNTIGMFLVPGVLAFAVKALSTQRVRDAAAFLLFLAACVWNVHAVDSATSEVVLIFLGVAFVLCFFRPIRRSNPFTWLFLAFLADILVAVVRIQDFFADALRSFNRSTTFTGRTGIWDRAMELIKEAPVWGYGYEVTSRSSTRFGSAVITSPHNIYFTNLYYGGVVGLALFVMCLLVAAKQLLGQRGLVAGYMKLFMPTVLIMGIFESLGIGLSLLIVPLVFTYCAPSIDSVYKAQAVA